MYYNYGYDVIDEQDDNEQDDSICFETSSDIDIEASCTDTEDVDDCYISGPVSIMWWLYNMY